jgi:hypothetical protein
MNLRNNSQNLCCMDGSAVMANTSSNTQFYLSIYRNNCRHLQLVTPMIVRVFLFHCLVFPVLLFWCPTCATWCRYWCTLFKYVWGACLCTPAFWCALWTYTNIIGVHTCAHQNLGVPEVKVLCA